MATPNGILFLRLYHLRGRIAYTLCYVLFQNRSYYNNANDLYTKYACNEQIRVYSLEYNYKDAESHGLISFFVNT